MEDRIECHFSPSRNGMRFMYRKVITDASKVAMVHLAKEGEFMGLGHVIQMARRSLPKDSRSSWRARMCGSERAADTVGRKVNQMLGQQVRAY